MCFPSLGRRGFPQINCTRSLSLGWLVMALPCWLWSSAIRTNHSISQNGGYLHVSVGGVLPYLGYMETCCWSGMVSTIQTEKGYICILKCWLLNNHQSWPKLIDKKFSLRLYLFTLVQTSLQVFLPSVLVVLLFNICLFEIVLVLFLTTSNHDFRGQLSIL